jgi:hypothetical protein
MDLNQNPERHCGLVAEKFDLDLFALRRPVRLPKQKSKDSTHLLRLAAQMALSNMTPLAPA